MFLRVVLALAMGILAYLVGAFGGGVLIEQFSSNNFDRSMEAAMTGAFVTGPSAGVVGFFVALFWPRKRKADTPEEP